MIVSPKYDDIRSFSNGYAIVLDGDKYGIINQNGREIVSPKYDMLDSFNEGIAMYRKGGKLGYIDSKGNEIIATNAEHAKLILASK